MSAWGTERRKRLEICLCTSTFIELPRNYLDEIIQMMGWRSDMRSCQTPWSESNGVQVCCVERNGEHPPPPELYLGKGAPSMVLMVMRLAWRRRLAERQFGTKGIMD